MTLPAAVLQSLKTATAKSCGDANLLSIACWKLDKMRVVTDALEKQVPIEVCVIEDHADYRAALCEAIAVSENIRCPCAFSNVESALEALSTGKASPHIILLDIGLPGLDGLSAIPMLQRARPTAKILVLTIHGDKLKVFRALGAGAFGYIVKSSSIESVLRSIEDAHNGIARLSVEIAQLVFTTFTKYKPASSDVELTTRELEVLQGLAGGANRKQVAGSLHVSPYTVDEHVRRIYRKLQVHNLSGAIASAEQRGLL